MAPADTVPRRIPADFAAGAVTLTALPAADRAVSGLGRDPWAQGRPPRGDPVAPHDGPRWEPGTAGADFLA